MGRTKNLALATAALLAACGGGGGGTGSSGNGGSAAAAFGAVQLLQHAPADGAVQVAVDAVIRFEFDAPMALDTFGDEDTWLRKVGSTTNVPGSFARPTQRGITFTPAAPLDPESDYTCQLSGLTSDLDGRILDATASFTFRTFDATAPALTAVSVVDYSVDQPRDASYQLTYSEAIAPASVDENSLYLRDSFGFRYPAARTVDGTVVTLRPLADLPGARQFFLVVTDGIADRAGNQATGGAVTHFRTVLDADAPTVLSAWPPLNRTGVSPLVEPAITFDEAMDPGSVEPASLLFQDEFGSVVAFSVASSPDQRSLRVRPGSALQPGRRYTLAFLVGEAGATDVSGNVLAATQALSFTTGSDAAPPVLASSVPSAGQSRVSTNCIVELHYDEALDDQWISEATAQLVVDGQDWVAVVEHPTADTIRLTPVPMLPTDAACTVTLTGGHAGVRDLAGNPLPGDFGLSFTTSSDPTLPHVMLQPSDGASDIATNVHVSVVFDAPMDPTTLRADTVLVTDDSGQPLAGSLVAGQGNRVATFTPATPFSPLTYYRIRVVGGAAGVQRVTGSWFAEDQTGRFRCGGSADNAPPTLGVRLNAIDASRVQGLVLPPSGFTVDVTAGDTGNQWADMGTVAVLLQGPGGAPDAAQLYLTAKVGYGSFQATVAGATPLTPGDWTATVTVRDLAGNLATAEPLPFQVATPTGELMPFERTQLVWVRTDLDRDNNGRPDFDDDLVRLGFAVDGDPAGTTARLRTLLLDGIVAQANRLYGRGSRGEPLDAGSVGLRFTKRQPIALQHMQMALGGYDPDGNRARGYADATTGVLGRAYYDYRNGDPGERNTSTSPGLGVFPGEMWLYQTEIHEQVYPAFLTLFAQRFRPLIPQMGGTPVGTNPLDAVVLAPGFVFATATPPQRARWQTIMDAADDWATVIGIILAHEVGHSVGLVAPGAAPSGLFGDATLHDTFAGATEVMAPSVGYEAMTTLQYQFRDIDLAYLRQRILLR